MPKKTKTSVLIATRKDPDLRATVASIRDNSGCAVEVYEDAQGRGPMAVRHELACKSRAEVLIIMDGHMRVKPGTLDAAAEYVGNRGNKVACLRCFHSPQEDWTGTPYAGASLRMKGIGKDAKEPLAFVAKWRRIQSAGKIGAVMGACYVMRRDWYMDGLGAPWQVGKGWGCDEELISAASYLRGGEVELLPWAVWHREQTAKTRGFRYTDAQILAVFVNRLSLLQCLPMPNGLRNELVTHIMPSLTRQQWTLVAQECDKMSDKTAEIREFLAAGGLSWDDFVRTVMEKENVKMPSMMELREQARAAGLTVPFGCRKTDLQVMLDGMTVVKPAGAAKPAPKISAPRANWGPNEVNNLQKRECVHCGGLGTEVVGVRRVGRLTLRQRNCRECGKSFPTRDVCSTP